MPNWKFWEKAPEQPPTTPTAQGSEQRFRLKPRTDLAKPELDPAHAEQLTRLHRQRDTVLFDVEQAEAAQEADNAWLRRVALLDDALATIRTERERAQAISEPPGLPLPPLPIEGIAYAAEPSPTVSFRIDGQSFRYEEAIDWAERGFQLARSELERVDGDPETLIPDDLSAEAHGALRDHLTASLFVFASDVRDRALNGMPLPKEPTLADLARPDKANGGWLDWLGHSSAAARKDAVARGYEVEEQRLLDERARELAELAKWQDRLPIARRRLEDVDTAIAALVGNR